MEAPRIVDHLQKARHAINLAYFAFFQPSIENGAIKKLHPTATILSIAELIIPGEKIIPFHIHSGTEKAYSLISGSMEIIMTHDGHWETKTLTCGSRLLVPPKTWHAVINHEVDPCRVIVYKSSQQQDCIWEPSLEELLQNAHRKAA